MVNQLLSTGTRLDTVRKISVVGGVLAEKVARSTLSAFPSLVSFMNNYGMTESNGCVCMPPKDSICYANVGFPAPMVQIKVRVFYLKTPVVYSYPPIQNSLVSTLHQNIS